MIELIFSIVIVGLWLGIVYRIRKAYDSHKCILTASNEMESIINELNALDINDDVIEKRAELNKRLKKLEKRQDKLSR